jgi:hypothetical protein
MPVASVQALLQDAYDFYVGADITVGFIVDGYYCPTGGGGPSVTVNWRATGMGIEVEA